MSTVPNCPRCGHTGFQVTNTRMFSQNGSTDDYALIHCVKCGTTVGAVPAVEKKASVVSLKQYPAGI